MITTLTILAIIITPLWLLSDTITYFLTEGTGKSFSANELKGFR